MADRYQRLLNDSIIIAIGNFSTKLLWFFLVPLYTNVLTTEQYATADLISNLVTLLIPFFTLCITDALFRFLLEDNRKQNEMLLLSYTVINIGFFLLILLSAILMRFYDKYYILAFLFLYLTTAYKSLFLQFIRAKRKIKLYSFSSVFGAFLLIIFNLLFLMIFRMGVLGYILSFVLSDIIVLIIIIILDREQIGFKKIKRVNKHLLKSMLAYSIFLIPNSAAWWLANVSDRYFLLVLCGSGITGIYAAATKVPAIINVLSTIFQQAWQISSVDEYKSTDKNKYYSIVFNIYSSFLFIGCSGVILFTPIISKFLLAKEFYIGWVYTPILVLAALFSSFSYFFGTFYTVVKKNSMVMTTTILGAGVNIILNIIFIKPFGAYGAALTTLVSYFLVFIIRYIDTKKFVKIDLNIMDFVISTLFLFIQSTTYIIFEFNFISLLINFLCSSILLLLNSRLKIMYSMVRKLITTMPVDKTKLLSKKTR